MSVAVYASGEEPQPGDIVEQGSPRGMLRRTTVLRVGDRWIELTGMTGSYSVASWRLVSRVGVAKEIEEHNAKWREYEDKYILPCFKWAKESGLDLEAAVRDNPGHNCVELLVRWLQTHVSAVRDYAGAIDSVREAVGYKYAQHYLSIAVDLKTLVEAIESRCDAMVVLKRIRGG